MSEPLKVVLVGAGAMGRWWLRVIGESRDVELAAIVDVDEAAAEKAVGGRVPSGSSLTALADGAEAVINASPPEAHHPITLEAFELGLPVLGEKPLASSMSEAVALAEAADESGLLFMVSQSRRYNPQLAALKAALPDLGGVELVTTEFFRPVRPGGFREEMAHPLLLDMAIHPFDMVRYLLDADPVAVYCEEFNPTWSWYTGGAATTAIFELTGGRRYTYTACWASPGPDGSWNGSWRLNGSRGTALWDGENPAVVHVDDVAKTLPDAPGPGLEIVGSLAEFVDAVRTGRRPMGEVRDNLLSLAMVFAAVESAETGRRVAISEVLQ